MLPNSFNEGSITLTPKPDNEEEIITIFFMNIDEKMSVKYLLSKF
jgi:hypothetical protein